MPLHLPTFKITLNPCPVSPDAFTPHAEGNFCSSCQRVVHDFSQSENPLADLTAARVASSDGRVCGSFRREQIVVPSAPTLSRQLRWFIMALVLVVGQGLTAREALAQVRKPVPHKLATPHHKQASAAKKQIPEDLLQFKGEAAPLLETERLSGDITVFPVATPPVRNGNYIYTYVEHMPQLPGGGGNSAIVTHIQQRVRWPIALSRTTVEGRVYASFIVGKDGSVREARIVKGLDPLLDAETLRVIQALPAFTPGRQGGEVVDVSFTVPVTFKR